MTSSISNSSSNNFSSALLAAGAESSLIVFALRNAEKQAALVGKQITKQSALTICKNYPFFASCSVPLLTSIIFVNRILREKGASPLTAGLAAGAASTFLHPLECAIYHQHPSHSIYSRLVHLYKAKGFNGFKPGIVSFALRNTIYSLGLNTISPWISKRLTPCIKNKVSRDAMGGAIGGLIGGIASQPLHFLSVSFKMAEKKPTSVSEIWVWLSKQPIKNFFSGMNLRLVRTTGGASLINLVLGVMEKRR